MDVFSVFAGRKRTEAWSDGRHRDGQHSGRRQGSRTDGHVGRRDSRGAFRSRSQPPALGAGCDRGEAGRGQKSRRVRRSWPEARAPIRDESVREVDRRTPPACGVLRLRREPAAAHSAASNPTRDVGADQRADGFGVSCVLASIIGSPYPGSFATTDSPFHQTGLNVFEPGASVVRLGASVKDGTARWSGRRLV